MTTQQEKQEILNRVYRIINKATGTLGGNGSGGPIYGEFTQSTMARVVEFLKANCEFNETSTFVDIGSGLGKPSLYVSIDPGVHISYGIEIEELRWQLSLVNLKQILEEEGLNPQAFFECRDVCSVAHFNSFSHVYMADAGFPPNVLQQIAEIYNHSTSPYLISMQNPRSIIDYYGFQVNLIGKVAIKLHGSGEGHQIYFYSRSNQSQGMLMEQYQPCPFQYGINFALGPKAELLDYLAVTLENTLYQTGRKRKRTPVKPFQFK